MAATFFILFVGSNSWSIGVSPTVDGSLIDVPLDSDATATQIAAAVLSSLETAGYAGAAVAIGIPSAWCLSASISTADLGRNDAKAMLYRLEEKLPLAAESVIGDFITIENEQALGVCVRIESISTLVSALEAVGVTVQSIFPTVLATAQGLGQSSSRSPRLLLCGEPGVSEAQLNVVSIQNGRPAHWDLLPATADDLKLQLELLSAEFGSIPQIEAIDVDDAQVDAFAEACAQVINTRPERGSVVAAAFAAEVLKGHAKPWIEFRRDQLAMGDPLRQHRRWIDAAIAATVVCLLSLTLGFVFRAHRYRQIEQTSHDQMVAGFVQHFPGWEIPVNVRAVVDAQYRRASGAAGTVAPQVGHGSALTTLHDVLLQMMAQDHFRIDRMAFHEGSFEVSGKLQSYEQVDALSKAARAGGMVVAPAQTRKDADGTWTFSLTGTQTSHPSVN